MSDTLNATRELLRFSRTSKNVETLRGKFLACYEELEAQKPSFVSVVEAAFEGLKTHDAKVAVYRAAALQISRRVDKGEDGTSSHAYHNPLHFSTVVVNFRALASIHNSFCSRDMLSDQGIAGGILAATAHDIRHNGLGNTVNGQHQQFRLEQHAIETAVSWAPGQNKKQKALIRAALVSIYATDVSSDQIHMSPAHFVRAMYDARKDQDLPKTPYCSALSAAFNSRTKIVVASLLGDADVFSSLLAENFSVSQDKKVRTETLQTTGRTPSGNSRERFWRFIVQGRSTTDTARHFTEPFLKPKMAQLKRAGL